jgi:ATP-dependent exoDNAse (exonuclease V) beta subunit
VPIAATGSRRASVAGHYERHALNLSLRSEEGRVVGTAVHSWLERVAQDGLAAWPPERLDSLRPALRAAMQGEGVPLQRLEVCLERALAALHTTLHSPRGRWILAAHRDAACELALTGAIADTPVHAVIDRTFTDEQGVCWMIDYKTSCQGEGEAVEDFLVRETERYRAQLANYRRLLELRAPQQEVRAALYFPLLDAWCEVG